MRDERGPRTVGLIKIKISLDTPRFVPIDTTRREEIPLEKEGYT